MAQHGSSLALVEGRGHAPSLSEAAERLGIQVDKLSKSFGVVPIDPANNIYVVEVMNDTKKDDDELNNGEIFSNPRIEHF